MPQPAAPLNIGQIGDATNLAIQKMFKKEASVELSLKKYYNFRTTTDEIEKDSSLSGLSEAEFTSENSEIAEDVPVQGYDMSYTQEAVDIIVPFTYRAWKFGIKKRNLANVAKEINNALNRKKEKLAAERLTNGFSTTYTHQGVRANKSISLLGGDGLEPWSAVHTREDGGSNMNNVVYDGTTYSLPFDYAGYKAAIRTASLFVDPRGNPMPAMLDTLVCKRGSSVSFKAKEILAAIKKGQIPESNDNDGAGAPAFKILELDYLTQDAYWFMFDSSMALTDTYGFQFIESEANNLDPVNIVTKTREMQFAGHTMFQLGHNDVARCWVASAGDSSTS
jgi:hypothetical protein